MSELDTMSRSEVGRIKAFMSCRFDRYRQVWGTHPEEFPRQCVFSGSGNMNDYLRDPTGGRRFWPVRCGTIRIDELARDRDQLWAEAVQRYRADLPWFLETPELCSLAETEQAERYEQDPWHEGIARWLEPYTDNVSMDDVLRDCTHKSRDQWTQEVKNRVGRILKALGWESYRVRIGSLRVYRYRRSVSP